MEAAVLLASMHGDCYRERRFISDLVLRLGKASGQCSALTSSAGSARTRTGCSTGRGRDRRTMNEGAAAAQCKLIEFS
jgi:hypothetical protein